MVGNINKKFIFKSGLKLPHCIFPGPMDGVMSPLFCRTAEALDLIDFWMTPFLRITTGPTGKSKILKFTERFSEVGKPVIVQLMGTDPKLIIRTALRCKEMGFAGVNFNLACPSPQVLSSGSGGALLKKHGFIQELMEASIDLGKDFSVSLKIRMGLEFPNEIEEIAKFAKLGNPDFVVVHHRTVSEGYRLVQNREERIAEAVKYFGDTPVVANGDIDSSDDAERIVYETGSVGVMVARNWLKNPNLIRDIQTGKNPTEEEQKNSLAKFIHAMAVYAQNNPRERDKNSLIDMASYIFDRKHPFFDYIIQIPFNQPANELSKYKVLDLI